MDSAQRVAARPGLHLGRHICLVSPSWASRASSSRSTSRRHSDRCGRGTLIAGARAAATGQVTDLIARRGWSVEPDAPALSTLIETVAALRTLGQDNLVSFLDDYADAVERFTELEIDAVTANPTRDQLAESVVIGTILGETLISSLRLLAQESISAQRWSST